MLKRLLFTLLSLFIVTSVYSQQPRYSRIKMSGDVNIFQIAELGLSLENVDYRPGVHIIGEYSENELLQLDSAGIPYEIMIWDMAYYYQARNHQIDKQQVEALMRETDPGKTYQTPENFSLGSMGGFHTYSEAMQDLDLMKILFPDLISARQPLSDSITTHECRQVYWTRISNNAEVTQDKPRVMYVALLHAREPASLQQMLYQMWYLLENYGSDPEITYLMDNMEMYFVPVINPDGYIFNESTNPDGGGMHRKNMRVNSHGNYGVDLNRNFGFEWGYDDFGSSPNPSSMTYRGPYAFSEPETRMLKEFSEKYNFRLALDNHTYSDLLIYPWGYENLLTPDAEVFIEFAKLLTRENNYQYGTVYETLYYTANGGATDWFYGEQQTKDKVFAFTPEAGKQSDGFWPAIDRIEDICAGHTQMNLYLARLALPYAEVEISENFGVNELDFYLPFEITSYGVDSTSDFTVSVNPISALISGVGQPVEFQDMQLLETRQDSILINLHEYAYQGLIFDFEILVDNGMFAWRDTISRAFGWPNYVFFDDFSDDSNWTSSSWGLASNTYTSAPYSMADSPGSNYPNNANTSIMLNDTIDLRSYSTAFVEFSARWYTERNYDFAQFRISDDYGETWVPLEGKFTSPGTSHQDPGQPVYHGLGLTWVREHISLDEYIGKQVMLGFRFVSDNAINHEGFYFDDFGVAAHRFFDPAPVITGQQKIELPKGESLEMHSGLITVIDHFYSWPGDHQIEIHEGENYSVNGNTIIPDGDFVGELTVSVSVQNEIAESDIYGFIIRYTGTVNVEDVTASQTNIYYNPSQKTICIMPGNTLPAGAYLLILYDSTGREIMRRDFYNHSSLVNIPASLEKGILFFEIQGEKVISGKISTF